LEFCGIFEIILSANRVSTLGGVFMRKDLPPSSENFRHIERETTTDVNPHPKWRIADISGISGGNSTKRGKTGQ